MEWTYDRAVLEKLQLVRRSHEGLDLMGRIEAGPGQQGEEKQAAEIKLY